MDDLLARMQDEVKLDKKSAELNAARDKELFDRIERLKENSPVKQKSSKSFSFSDTKALMTTNLYAQTNIASEFAHRSNNTQEVQSLNSLSSTLKEMGNIIDNIPTIPQKYETQYQALFLKV